MAADKESIINLLKGLGPVFAEVQFKNNPKMNHKVYSEFITIDEFNRL